MADRDMAIATKLIKRCNLNSMPIIFYLLMDREENWLYLLKTRAAYKKFTESEKEMYSRFIGKDSRGVVRKITSEFNRMLNEKRILTDNGETIFANRVNQLSELRNVVELRKESLDKNIASVLNEIKNPTGDSTTLLNHIISAINLKPCENIMIELEKAKQLLDEFHHMRMNIDSNNISELETDYINRWKGTLCDNYMLSLIKSVKTKLSNRRDEWMRKNVIGVYTSIDTMTTAQCVKWQAIVSELPEFLEESDLAEITKLSETVREKIKSQRIQGVVEMFNALSNDEKIECLRILKM